MLENVFSAAELEEIRFLIDSWWEKAGSWPLTGRGAGIHPLLDHIPEFDAFLTRTVLLDAVSLILGGAAQVMRSGARLSDEHSDKLLAHWHNHYNWNPVRLAHRTEIERVLAVIYIDGSGPDMPSYLVCRPRSLNDPLGHPPGENDPAEIVELKPGGIVVFDSALWHAAFRGSAPGRRRIVGAHFQTAAITLPHPNDDYAGGVRTLPPVQA